MQEISSLIPRLNQETDIEEEHDRITMHVITI